MVLNFVTNKNFPVIKIFLNYRNFYGTVQIMKIEEDNSQQGKMNTPTLEEVLVVESNSDILKTIHNLQAELQSFREDSLNERKEQ